MKRAMLLLPTLDEAEGLTQVLPRIPLEQLSEKGWDLEIVVVDGGSEDETKKIATEFGCTFMLQQGKGKGAAMVRDRRRGDILCRVIVETPSNLDKQQTKLLNELTKSLNQSKNFPGTDTFLKAISKIKD